MSIKDHVKSHDCQFCQKPCDGPSPEDKELITAWWFCKGCNAHHETHYTGALTRVILDLEFRDATYGVQLLYFSNETCIVKYPEKPDDTLIEVAYFPYIIPHINPQNVRAKLATYLIFS